MTRWRRSARADLPEIVGLSLATARVVVTFGVEARVLVRERRRLAALRREK